MPRKLWPLIDGRPAVQVEFKLAENGGAASRTLLADTGAGSHQATFELILDEQDCVRFGGQFCAAAALGGAYQGHFPVYLVKATIASIEFDGELRAVGVNTSIHNLDGIAGFRFLNQFTYGNFGDSSQFGLEFGEVET